MELDRTISRTAVDESRHRYTIRVWAPRCEIGDERSVAIRFGLIRAVLDNPDLIDCGGSRFERLNVTYDLGAGRWVLEASAIA